MCHYQDELKQITGMLLKPDDDFGELSKAIQDLQELFLTVSGLETDNSTLREDIYLANGKAIGPVWAAMCIKEHLRTKRFLRGFYLGIKCALEKFPCRPVHILYAGTGPFATLAVPLTTVFTSDEVHFTFLEINPESIRLLKNVVAAFQIEPYVNDIIRCDAATYQGDPSRPIHMIITETMQNALQKEPQVAITLNLIHQLEEGGILIPQNIVIEAALMNPRKNMERIAGLNGSPQECYHLLGTIFELNKHTPSPVGTKELPSFTAIEIGVPNNIPVEFHHLCLFTTIRVFEEEALTPWECSLTQPQRIAVLNRDKSPVDKVSFRYVMNEKPGFEFKIL